MRGALICGQLAGGGDQYVVDPPAALRVRPADGVLTDGTVFEPARGGQYLHGLRPG